MQNLCKKQRKSEKKKKKKRERSQKKSLRNLKKKKSLSLSRKTYTKSLFLSSTLYILWIRFWDGFSSLITKLIPPFAFVNIYIYIYVCVCVCVCVYKVHLFLTLLCKQLPFLVPMNQMQKRSYKFIFFSGIKFNKREISQQRCSIATYFKNYHMLVQCSIFGILRFNLVVCW